jgi:ABC-type transport system substrate-binding protein
MKTVLQSLFLVLSVIVMTSPALSQSPATGGTLTVCQPAEPPGLDPTTNTAAAIDRVVYANILRGW